MRVLVVAYDFPPIGSPQSIRWAYMSNALAALGCEVHVLTTRFALPMTGLPAAAGVTVHRTFAGPLIGAVNWLSSQARPERYSEAAQPQTQRKSAQTAVFRLVRRVSDALWFPDTRSEWQLNGAHAFAKLMESRRFDVVVGSHEPVVSLMLAMRARRWSVPWVADLGDPVLTQYTPRRWRRRAKALEGVVAQQASRLVVTSSATRDWLTSQHGIHEGRVSVITQGFASQAAAPVVRQNEAELTLLFSGRFYPFRDPEPLLKAVEQVPDVRLLIMGDLDAAMQARIAGLGTRKVEYIGNASHELALRLQRETDVLVNLGNQVAVQVPGKLYEYLGACRPILQIEQDPADEGSALVRKYRRGWISCARPDALVHILAHLVERKKNGCLESDLDLSSESVGEFEWGRLAMRYRDVLSDVIATSTGV